MKLALSKPLADLAWADVETFCEGRITEGSTLDYKREFPTKLEKTNPIPGTDCALSEMACCRSS